MSWCFKIIHITDLPSKVIVQKVTPRALHLCVFKVLNDAKHELYNSRKYFEVLLKYFEVIMKVGGFLGL